MSLRELVLDQHDASSQQVYALLCPKSPETEKKPLKRHQTFFTVSPQMV